MNLYKRMKKGTKYIYKKVSASYVKSKPFRKSMGREGRRIQDNLNEYLKPGNSMKNFPKTKDLLGD